MRLRWPPLKRELWIRGVSLLVVKAVIKHVLIENCHWALVDEVRVMGNRRRCQERYGRLLTALAGKKGHHQAASLMREWRAPRNSNPQGWFVVAKVKTAAY